MKKNKANALITALFTLCVLSTMAVSFVQLSSLENQAAANYSDILQGNFLAQAGLDYAILQLRSDFHQNPTKVSNSWLYRYTSTTTQRIAQNPADDIPITEIYSKADAAPSYQRPIDTADADHPVRGRKISARAVENVAGSEYRVYTLKILDTTSQINLNSHILPTSAEDETTMGELLDKLSSYIANDYSYEKLTGGPLHGLGKQIIAKRNQLQGFQTKSEILGTYQKDGMDVEITLEDLRYVWDYLTVHPTRDDLKAFALYKTLAPMVPPVEGNYRLDYRSPVNINTASEIVLTALLDGLSGGGVSITPAEAVSLARQICIERQKVFVEYTTDMVGKKIKAFYDWDTFYAFLELQTETVTTGNPGGIFSGLGKTEAAAKVALLKANFNPQVTLKRTNPDAPLYQSINKTELSHYTTEFCFYPLGRFEITSLGQILDAEGNPIVSNQRYALVRIFDVMHYKSQYDFEGGHSQLFYGLASTGKLDLSLRQNDYQNEVKGLHAFSYGNNLWSPQKVYSTKENFWSATSPFFGHILPMGYNLSVGGSLDTETNKLFELNFNGSYKGQKRDNTWVYASGDEEFGGDPNPAFPADTKGSLSSHGNLLSDGIVFPSANAANAKLLYYEAPAATGDIFPPLVTPLFKDGPNRGTLMFWFKLNRDWLDTTARTVFLSTHKYPYPIGFTCGVQREIKMTVLGPDGTVAIESAMPLLRKVQISIEYKFFCYKDGNPKNPGISPYKHVKYGRILVFDPKNNKRIGLHASEWYHLALRWRDGTSMEDFTGDTNLNGSSIILSGNCYNEADTPYTQGKWYDKDVDEIMVPSIEFHPINIDDTDDYGNLIKTPDPDFQALYPAKIDENRFYLGSAQLTASPSITLDDFRISAICDNKQGIDHPNYLPSRFPSYAAKEIDGQYFYGVFQGYLRGEPGSTVSALLWQSRSWGKITPVTKQADKYDGYSLAVWEKIWNMMVENEGMNSIMKNCVKNPGRYRVSLEVKVVYKKKGAGPNAKWEWKKPIDVYLFDYGWWIDWKRKEGSPNSVYPPEAPSETGSSTDDGYTFTGSQNVPLTTILKNWFALMRSKGHFQDENNDQLSDFEEATAESTPVDATGDPYVLKDDKDLAYSLFFPVDYASSAIYQSPIIDAVIMLYRPPQVLFKEIYDGLALPEPIQRK